MVVHVLVVGEGKARELRFVNEDGKQLTIDFRNWLEGDERRGGVYRIKDGNSQYDLAINFAQVALLYPM